MFIPQFADPVDPDVNPLIWREVNLYWRKMALGSSSRTRAVI